VSTFPSVSGAQPIKAWRKLGFEMIRVKRTEPASLSLPAGLAARAVFLARLHRTQSVEEWLRRVIQERVELEEAAFAGIKQNFAARTDSHKR
jgi:hypothetical protein